MKAKSLPKEYLEELGHRIKLVRVFLKYEQKDMAKQLRIDQSQVSRIEAGKATHSLLQLLTIKRLADKNENLKGKLSWSWLLEGKGAEIF